MSKAICFQPSLAQVISQNLYMFSELWNFKNLTVCFHFSQNCHESRRLSSSWVECGTHTAVRGRAWRGRTRRYDTEYIYNTKILYHSTGWPNVSNKFNSTMLNDFESRCWIPLATIDPVLTFLVTQSSKHFRRFLIKWKKSARYTLP